MIGTISNIETLEVNDLLNRQEFVNRLLSITEVLSNNSKSCCFAINGTWGVGKTFILDMFEKQAKDIGKEGSTLSRYLIFRYNCWEYDYYEEPLIAIVASILDEIEEKTNILSSEARTTIVETLKAIGKDLLKNTLTLAQSNTGIPFKQLYELLVESHSNTLEAIECSREFDEFITFKKTLKKLRETIESLSKHQTVLFIVDELDRCLPEYAIKVLERLHHLFDSLPNVQLILSIDKVQLEHVVRQIYGENTNVNKYLAKFIDFELKLSEGSFVDIERFNERFKQYINLFENVFLSRKSWEIEEYLQEVFEGIDIRSRIAIIDKCLLLHNILWNKAEPCDLSNMCIELLLILVKQMGVDIHKATHSFSKYSPFIMKENKTLPTGLIQLIAKYKETHARSQYIVSQDDLPYYCTDNIWGITLEAYRCVIISEGKPKADNIIPNTDIWTYATNFWHLLDVVE